MKFKKILSGVLAAVLLLGLIPGTSFVGTAFAATPPAGVPEKITLKDSDYGGYGSKKYVSPNGLGTCYIHRFTMAAGESEVYGFCYDHSLSMGPEYVGQTWNYNTTAGKGASDVYPFLPFLDWWIYAVELSEKMDIDNPNLSDKEKIALDGSYLTDFARTWTNAWVQSAVWLAQDGKVKDCHSDADIQLIAAERDAVLLAYGINPNADPNWSSEKLLKGWVARWDNGDFGKRDYYLYYPNNNKVQPILIPETIFPDGPGTREGFLKVLKGGPDGSALPGATFSVYLSSSGKTSVGTMVTGADGSAAFKVKFSGTLEQQTFWVQETKAPTGFIANKTRYPVLVDSTQNATEATAALVNGGAAILNPLTPPPPDPPEGFLTKVDSATGIGVGPATFNFTGNTEGGSGVDADYTAGANGALDLQWLDPGGDNYIAPGEYTVTEKIPPPGYENTTESKHLRLWIEEEIDKDGNIIKIPMSSGPLVFKNDKKHTVLISKVDGEGNPLAGASFDVYKNDQKLTSIGPTDASGTIVFEGVDGKGLETGYYEFVETQAPAGYVLPFIPHQSLWVDSANPDIDTYMLTFVNEEYPEIIIKKVEKGTANRLAGAVFEVMIDGRNLGTIGPTGDNGLLRIDYDTYGKYLGEGKDSWTIQVREVTAPDGYMIDDRNWQTAELERGQTLAEFVFTNTHYRDIKVTKKDAQTGWLLAGAEFTLHCIAIAPPGSPGNIVDRILTTDATGSVLFEDIPDGTYELTETKAPEGYEINPEKKIIVIGADTDPVLEFEFQNEPKSGFLIRKIDSVTKQPIPNVEFRVTPLAPLTGPSWTAVTNDNGVIVKENLEAGTYRIEEITTVDGYVLNTEPQLLEVTNQHDAFTVTFENNQKNMLNVLKLDAVTKLPLAGAIFNVSTAGGTHVATITTGIYGYANLPNLKPGSYVVQEVEAPDGHIIDNMPQFFEVKDDSSGNVYTLVFSNNPFSNIYIRKYDSLSKVGLEGAVFRITKSDGTIIAEAAKTDAMGFIHVDKLYGGTYLIQEIKAPDGYLLDDTVYTLQIHDGETKTIEIENKKPGGAAVKKVDAATGEALPGATFELRTIEGKLISSITTGADGYARWADLTPGWYVLKETEAPEGYALDPTPRNIEVKEFISTEIEWKNSQDASLTVVKRDKATGIGLKGAIFEVRTMSGDVVATLTTDVNGTATTSRLAPGWYKIVETKAPDGYVLNEEEKLVEITANAPANVDFFNEAMKGIVIHKVDAVTMEPLAGAVFEIRTAGDKLVEAYTTDTSGTITTKALDPGNYLVIETKAPDGYVLNEERVPVVVEEGKASVVTVKNFPKTIIQIYKTDAVSGSPLHGAEFEIMKSDGKSLGFITTDKTGWANSLTLAPGEYIIKETKAPTGYTLDAKEHRVVVVDGENTIIRITNTPDTALHISKIDSITREPLAGAVFEIRCDTGHGPCTLHGTYTTDELGMLATEPLTPGFHMIKEIAAPDGYRIITEEYRFCVKAGEFNQLVVENQQAGTLIVRKIDSKTNKPIAGAVFKVEGADRMDLIGTKETDANGEAIFTGLDEGYYIVTETQAPDGYVISTHPQTIFVEYGKKNYLDFKDDENGSLKIVLQDKTTDEYLYGGHFTVTDEKTQIVVFDGSTDTTGTIVVGNLPAGWYTVTQTFPPDKYTMVDITTKVEVLIGTQQTVYFKDVTAGLVIEKVDKQYPTLMLEGARFQVKRDSDGVVIGEYVTGKDGLALIDGLTSGLYTVTELVAPQGYALDAEPQTIHVKDGTTAHATFLDTALSSITVNILEQGSRKPVAGAVVEVWEQNGVLVNTYTSDTTGVIQTDKLAAGYYVLKLVSVPDGYDVAADAEATVELKNNIETTHTFELVSKGNLKIMSVNSSEQALAGMRVTIATLDGAKVGEYTTGKDGAVIVSNLTPGWYVVTETKAPDGYSMPTTVEQKIEVTSSGQAIVTFRHGQNYGLQILTTCKQTGTKVPGAVYEVAQLNGAVIGTYTSDSAGLISVDLQPGWYSVRPVSAPDGYVIPNTTARNIEVKADGLTVTEFILNQMSSLRVKIVDGSSQSGLYNVRLQLKNGSSSIKEFYTDNEGYITLDNDVLNGSYTLEMISVPDGYTVDTVPKSISALVGQTTEVVWALYKEGGQIQVVVTSADHNKTLDKAAGSLLQGAVFSIMNADTYQVVGTMISDVSGVAASSALPIGRYIVTQTTAPAYYAASDKQVEVRLKIQNDVMRTEFTNTSVNLSTSITLKSNTTIRAGSNMRVDITAASNASDVRLDNFFVHIKVPTDAARVTTLSTGSWNQAVFFKVTYKTNMNDYRTLAENLLSTNVYSYGLSTQALGLQSGEYITDVRMEYGSVPAGMSMVKKMCYSQYVLATVYNGHKLLSRVELGGQFNTVNVSTNHIDNNNPYSTSGSSTIASGANSGNYAGAGSAAISGNSGQWTTSTGSWTTVVTSKVTLPGTLPKTGY